MTTRRSALGRQGEQIAADYLTRHGYDVTDVNWRCPTGEFDLIARRGQTVVFVEVKTRREGIEAAFESITPRKRQILERTAYLYLEQHELDTDWRIDVVAVTIPSRGAPAVEHIENALDW
ncbi:MAG: YraN family protein [Anaerolineae bacterium]|nr:YraN family protein [Anaerolineae bacterium]